MIHRLALKKQATGKATTPKQQARSATHKFVKSMKKTERVLNGQLVSVRTRLELKALSNRPEDQKTLDLKKPDGRGLHMKENPPSSEQMRKIRGMRNFYGKHMPKIQCNTCAYSTNCPQFKADYECAFMDVLNSHKIGSMEDIMHYMEDLLGANMQRVHLASLFERLSGGVPSAELSESYAMIFQQLQQLHNMKSGVSNIQVISPNGQPQVSVITQLFGNINLLVQQTDAHQGEISEALMEIPVEQSSSAAEITRSSVARRQEVHAELIDEQAANDPNAIISRVAKPKAPAAKGIMPLLTVSNLSKS